MYNEQKRLDVISNNMANSATAGYKREGVTSQSFHDMMTLKIRDASADWRKEYIGDMSLGVKIGEVYTDYGQGSFRETDETFDIAIEGSGFFTVAVTDNAGNVHTRYTRDGNFHMRADGMITDEDGNRLQADNGDLIVDVNTQDIVITSDGGVYEDGVLTNTLQMVDFEDYDYLKKFGDTYYEPVDGATQKNFTGFVRQGFIEQSNVNVVKEMVDMIAITRAYESNQKVIQTMDKVLDLSANSVGKV